jgi:hypothetical protein
MIGGMLMDDMTSYIVVPGTALFYGNRYLVQVRAFLGLPLYRIVFLLEDIS